MALIGHIETDLPKCQENDSLEASKLKQRLIGLQGRTFQIKCKNEVQHPISTYEVILP